MLMQFAAISSISMTIVKYCPMKNEKLCTSVVCHGRIGVWRIVNSDFDESTSNDEMDANGMFQPEQNGFRLLELAAGESAS